MKKLCFLEIEWNVSKNNPTMFNSTMHNPQHTIWMMHNVKCDNVECAQTCIMW